MPQRRPDAIVFRDGELARVNCNTRTADSMIGPNERMRWQRMLTHIAQARGYKSGWVAHKYKEKFKEWPRVSQADPIEPSPEVSSWVRSRQIAWAKSAARKAA
jgi:hypothetical protein